MQQNITVILGKDKKDSGYLVEGLLLIFICILKKKAEIWLLKNVKSLKMLLVLQKAPLEVRLLHKGSVVEIVEEIGETEVEARLLFGLNRSCVF